MVQPWERHLALVSESSARRDRQSYERRREQQHPVRDHLPGSAGIASADREHEGLQRAGTKSITRQLQALPWM